MKSPRSPPHTPSGSGLGAASPEISLQAQKKRISRRARRGLGPLDPLRINFPEALEQVLREEIKIGDEKDLELRSQRSAAPSPEPPPGLEWKDIKIEVLKSQGLHEPCNEKVTLAKTGSLPPINTEVYTNPRVLVLLPLLFC